MVTVLVNGRKTEKFLLSMSVERDGIDDMLDALKFAIFCGEIHAIFDGGNVLNTYIYKEINLPIGGAFHLYDTDEGKVTVEYIDD